MVREGCSLPRRPMAVNLQNAAVSTSVRRHSYEVHQSAISVEGLGKRYALGSAPTQSATLRDTLTDFASSPWRRFRELAGRTGTGPEFWALRHVDFQVRRGE